MAHTHPLSHYVKDTKESFIFIGDEAKVYIPTRYTACDFLFLEKDVRTLGIFEIEVSGEKETYGYVFPGIVTMCPSETYSKKINDKDYTVLVFKKNDIFFKSKEILRQSFIAYVMFTEFITNGNPPTFLKYKDIAMLFDTVQEVCAVSLKVPHSAFEMMYAHLTRDPDNPNIKYRHTDMKKKPLLIGLRAITYSVDSTTGKIIGSYMGNGINSAIVNKADQRFELEDLLRV